VYASSNVFFISVCLFLRETETFVMRNQIITSKNGENTLNFISKLKILVKNDRKLIFELLCNNKLIMYNNF
jgi:hypothetical protein